MTMRLNLELCSRARRSLLCVALIVLHVSISHAFSVPGVSFPRSLCSDAARRGRCNLHMQASSDGKSAAARLRLLLAEPKIHIMPCCFDALSARLIQRGGFDMTFMSGFSTSAAKIGMPDTGYIRSSLLPAFARSPQESRR